MKRTLVLAALLAPAAAFAQGAGGVPDYQAPPPVTVQRSGEVMKSAPKPESFGKTEATAELTSAFVAAYERAKRPRLALYWNRQLSDQLNEWYSPMRIVNRSESSSTMSGDITLNQTGSTQDTMEIQQRVRGQVRPQAPESFEWEFQDGFLAPFLDAGVQVIDRTAMVRLAGAELPSGPENTVEIKALQGKADYLMEILVGGNQRSTTGYELRARILEVNTGRIVAYVNSKGLKSWNPPKELIATEKGFVDPEDLDEDDETFGPQGEDRYKAGPNGFERRRKPPKLDKIARNLAYNVMDGLTRQWK